MAIPVPQGNANLRREPEPIYRALSPSHSAPSQAPQPQPLAPIVPTSPGTVNEMDNPYLKLFQDAEYFNDPEFRNIISQYQNKANEFGVDNSLPAYQQVSGYADDFRQQFQNKVGRPPNESEYAIFFKSLGAAGPWGQESTGFATKNKEMTRGLISDYFSSTAEEEATKRAEAMANKAVAPGSAFDVWQNQYRDSLNTVEKSLMDYQTRLFEKLRPSLITSLNTQGLLNSGALNKAFAGAASDLADTSSSYLANARGAVDQDIANQRYGIMKAPGDFALSSNFNRIPNLYSSGQTALNNVFNSYLQDQNFQNQMKLMESQRQEQPSLLATLGGQILGGAAAGYASRFGRPAAATAGR